MAQVIHTVVAGDTLSELAVKYNTTVSKLMSLNPDIKNKDLIYIDQEIVVSGDAKAETKDTTYVAAITAFGLQANSSNTLFATWKWSKSNTAKYAYRWTYTSGDQTFYGSVGEITVSKVDPESSKYSEYSIPANAESVSFQVKPVWGKEGSLGSGKAEWTCSWSAKKTYHFVATPSAPNVSITDKVLLAKLENITIPGVTSIEFQVILNNKSVAKNGTGKSNVSTGYASFSYPVTDGGNEYKVRCRAIRQDEDEFKKYYSAWSPYSSTVSTAPLAPSGITTCRASSETSIYLEWPASKTATGYTIQYATKKEYFDNNSNQIQSVTVNKETFCELGNLATGTEYFFRICATNSSGSSEWSGVTSISIGEPPIAPTTWSSTSSATTAEALYLYWVHNSADGSSQTYAQLELYVNDVKQVIPDIKNTEDEDEKDKTSTYQIDTSKYSEGAELRWRVRTAGVTNVYGDWSVERIVYIYAPPSLDLGITDSNGNFADVLDALPLHISAIASPETQIPIGYHLSIIANESYETVDTVGNSTSVNTGDEVYSRYFDTYEDLDVEISASEVELENNISYTVKCTVAMDSGLTAESTAEFTVAWTETSYWPNAAIEIDTSNYAAYIQPYCRDNDGNLIPDLILSVYRREFDGGFTEIATDLENDGAISVTDPHPALDYARYRIVARAKAGGAVSFYDMPGIEVGGKAVIIQWDEEWSDFDVSEDAEIVEAPWSGSLLKLPYNIDVSTDNTSDVTLVEYIGRKHPVSYYGTQLGESATWNVVIAKNDIETIYALRRLAKWMGDVYVREPSGSGYWANIKVGFSTKHRDMSIPVTLTIKRVEGGI